MILKTNITSCIAQGPCDKGRRRAQSVFFFIIYETNLFRKDPTDQCKFPNYQNELTSIKQQTHIYQSKKNKQNK